jgi:hypothetical protein
MMHWELGRKPDLAFPIGLETSVEIYFHGAKPTVETIETLIKLLRITQEAFGPDQGQQEKSEAE